MRYTSAPTDDFAGARWYAVRTAGNTKPATYRRPLYGERLPALAEHLLVLRDGDRRGGGSAHELCDAAMRERRRLDDATDAALEMQRGAAADAGRWLGDGVR